MRSSTQKNRLLEFCDSESVVKANKNAARDRIVFGVFCFGLAIYQIISLFSNFSGIITFLINYSIPLILSMLALIFCIIAAGIISFIEYREVKKYVAARIKYERSVFSKRNIILIVVVIISLLAMWVSYSQVQKDTFIPLSEYGDKVSFPLLEQISPDEASVLKSQIGNSGPYPPPGNDISKTSSFIAPVIIMVRQYSAQGSNEPGAFGYDVDYYKMRTEALAIRYANELRNQIGSNKLIRLQSITDINVKGFDSAVYYTTTTEGSPGVWESIILRSGNVVISAGYSGSASLRDRVDLFASQ